MTFPSDYHSYIKIVTIATRRDSEIFKIPVPIWILDSVMISNMYSSSISKSTVLFPQNQLSPHIVEE